MPDKVSKTPMSSKQNSQGSFLDLASRVASIPHEVSKQGSEGTLLDRATAAATKTAEAVKEAGEAQDENRKTEQLRLTMQTEKLVVDEECTLDQLDSFEKRLETFSFVWKGAATGRLVMFPDLSPLTPASLAWVGLYYLPDARVSDRTVCYSCGKAMHSWDPTDDPLYEHCRFNPQCSHLQSLADDNVMPMLPSSKPDATLPPSEFKIDWSSITEGLPKDTVVDHLLLVVHGIGTTDETLPTWVNHLRKTLEPAWQKKYLDIPLTVAVDAISWHDMSRAPQETMQSITLPTVPSLRTVINDTLLDVLYYRSPLYGQKMICAVAKLLNEKYALYKRHFTNFSGNVSLYCHSLGSVITFDILQNQNVDNSSKEGPKPGPHDIESLMFGEDSESTWIWPQLDFKPDNMFALGSPISMFVTTRGDIHEDWWPKGASSFFFPGGTRLFNIFDPTDPVAFRFEPLINPRYCSLQPVVIPQRQKRKTVVKEDTMAVRADFYGWQRVDYVLHEGSNSGVLGHLRAISNAHHCYWWSKDLSLFIIDTILNQRLYSHDSTSDQAATDMERFGPPAHRARAADGAKSLGADERSLELVAVKEQVLWLLTSDVLAAEVAPIAGCKSTATGGTFNYALGNLLVSSIDVPRHKVVVVVGEDGRVTVKATDISAKLKNFTWLYKQKGPPHLKDSGTADANISGLTLWLGLSRKQLDALARTNWHSISEAKLYSSKGGAADSKPVFETEVQGDSHGSNPAGAVASRRVGEGADVEHLDLPKGSVKGEGVSGKVGKNTVDVRLNIKTLDIDLHKTSSTMLAWLYRMLLAAFSQEMRVSVQESVANTLKERIVASQKAHAAVERSDSFK